MMFGAGPDGSALEPDVDSRIFPTHIDLYKSDKYTPYTKDAYHR